MCNNRLEHAGYQDIIPRCSANQIKPFVSHELKSLQRVEEYRNDMSVLSNFVYNTAAFADRSLCNTRMDLQFIRSCTDVIETYE